MLARASVVGVRGAVLAICQLVFKTAKATIPKNAAEVMELDGRQLEWLLAGLDVKEAHAEVKYSRII